MHLPRSFLYYKKICYVAYIHYERQLFFPAEFVQMSIWPNKVRLKIKIVAEISQYREDRQQHLLPELAISQLAMKESPLSSIIPGDNRNINITKYVYYVKYIYSLYYVTYIILIKNIKYSRPIFSS